jgi:energy-coupling factor transporter ATP-binding protein EcfA2
MGELTALVGPNGAGKSSVLRAVDVVLGSRWPSLASIQVPEDFTRFDAMRELSITVEFDPPLAHEDALRKTHDITALRVRCAPYKRSGSHGDAGDLHVDFDALDAKGETPMVAVGRSQGGSRPPFRPLTVGSGLRDQARALFIDHRRSLAQHLPGTRGSILGQLLAPARKEFEAAEARSPAGRDAFKERYEAAMAALRTDRLQEVESTIAETAKRMIGFLGSRAVANVDIRFGFADPANPFNSLRLDYSEEGLTVPGSVLGLGVQSAMVVGIFDALRRLGKSVGTLVIEEPEMYLHPQAQRYFYRLLCDMADSGDAQVIYSTHSPIFADATRFDCVRLVRRPVGQHSIVNFISKAEDRAYLAERRDKQKMVTGFNSSRSELFFAHKVLLVEGPGDQLAVRLTAERLGVDLDAEDLAVIECGSKFSIPFFAKVCVAFGIGFVVLHDEDIYAEDGDEEKKAKIRAQNAEHRKVNGEIALLAPDASQLFVFSPSLEARLGIGRHAADKPRWIVEALSALADASLPVEVTKAVEALR